MAFVISRGESAFPEAEKTSLEHLEDKDSATIGAISCQLQLKSSQRLGKQAVLQRIRHRKNLYRIRSAFEGLLGSTQGNTPYTRGGFSKMTLSLHLNHNS